MTPANDRPRSPNPLAPILDVAEALVSSLELDEALANMSAAIGDAMQVSKVDIYTYDRERDLLVYEARWVGDDLEDAAPRLNPQGGIIDVRARPSWRPILEGEIVEWHIGDPDLPEEEREIYARANQKTTLDAPLVAGDTVIGVLGVVQCDRVRRFTPLERDLFGHLCRLAAIGIRNAQTLRRDAACARHVETLHDAAGIVAGGGARDTVLQRLAAAACDGLGVDVASIYEYDDRADAVICRARHPVSVSLEAPSKLGEPVPIAHRAPTGDIIRTATAVVDHADDPRLDATERDALTELGVGTCVAAPAHHDGRPVGILYLCAREPQRHFGAGEITVAETFASLVALALRGA